MSTHHLPYGRGQVTFGLPVDWQVTVLAPTAVPGLADPRAAVGEAIDHPVPPGNAPLDRLAGVRSAAIAINDKTRPVPLAILLPPLLERLALLGVPDDAVTLLIATGTHPVMRPEEFPALLPPEILARYRVISHDCGAAADLVYLGKTTRGTPVWINRRFLVADVRIVVGDIEPHQFQGFSGGVKGAAIGLAGKATVDRNHSMMLDPEARPATFGRNPARQDVEEIGRMIGVHFVLDAVLNEEKQIAAVFAGAPDAVIEAGMPAARRLYEVPVAEPFDLLIASPGGHPKDINLYQAQKALAAAAAVTRPGAPIILAAACPEGSGSASYDAWMAGMTSHEAVIERFNREGFRIGAHKAFQVSRDALGRQVILVSDQSPGTVARWLLEPAASLADAVACVCSKLPARPHAGILPAGNVTVPVLLA